MVKRRAVLKFFEARGFVCHDGTRHDKLKHPDGRWTVLERRADIDDKLFEAMKKQAGLK